ncbi:MAG: rhodanese-like domain-containing protein [Gammaproteobacteria bacterium]
MMESLNVIQLKKELETDPQTVLLDVRDKWEYDLCHIDNSVNISLSEITERKDELDKQPRTVILCHHGMRSTIAGEYLISEGFEQIVNLEGGIDAWASTIDQSMTRY